MRRQLGMCATRRSVDVTISPSSATTKDLATWCCVVRRLLSGSRGQIAEGKWFTAGQGDTFHWLCRYLGIQFSADAVFHFLIIRKAWPELRNRRHQSVACVAVVVGGDYVNEILERLAQRCWEWWNLWGNGKLSPCHTPPEGDARCSPDSCYQEKKIPSNLCTPIVMT